MRYRALGRACQQQDVDALVLGHHRDDNHELGLLRLIKGSRAAGLSGMRTVTKTPSSDDIYGVGASGTFEPSGAPAMDPVPGFEKARILLLRPLLNVTKSELLATCVDAKAKWETDATNEDVTLTERNAVRKMLRTRALPLALRRTRILSLQRVCREEAEDVEALADEMFRACVVELFDVHLGLLTLHIPTPAMVFGEEHKTAWTPGLRSRVLQKFLRDVLEMVSPKRDLTSKDATHAYRTLFEDAAFPLSTFTEAHVYFYLCPDQTPAHVGFQRWKLIRSKPPLGSLAEFRAGIPIGARKTIEWTLWDNRWWFRVQNRSQHPIKIAPTSVEAVSTFRNSLLNHGVWLHSLLRQFGSAKALETLPAIVLAKDTDSALAGTIIGLPTIGLYLPGYANSIKCQARYKEVEKLANWRLLQFMPRVEGSRDRGRTPHQLVAPPIYALHRDSSLVGTKISTGNMLASPSQVLSRASLPAGWVGPRPQADTSARKERMPSARRVA